MEAAPVSAEPETLETSEPVGITRSDISSKLNTILDVMRSQGLQSRYLKEISWMLCLRGITINDQNEEVFADDEGRPAYVHLPAGYGRRWDEIMAEVNADNATQVIEKALRSIRGQGKGTESNKYDEDGNLIATMTPVEQRKKMGRVSTLFRNIGDAAIKNDAAMFNVLKLIDSIPMGSSEDDRILGQIYEDILARSMGNSKDLGEFFTPRHIIGAMMEVLNPKIGESVLDPFAGSGGMLTAAYQYMMSQDTTGHSLEDLEAQRRKFWGQELAPESHLTGQMNLILSGIDDYRFVNANTFERPMDEVRRKGFLGGEKPDVVAANPPYGGMPPGATEVSDNFAYPTNEMSVLGLQYVMNVLKRGGRAAVVMPSSILSTVGTKAFVEVRRELLTQYNLEAVLRLPGGVFAPYTNVSTCILFFRNEGSGSASWKDNVWFYDLEDDGFDFGVNRNPIEANDLPDFMARFAERSEGPKSWLVAKSEVDTKTWSLDFRNPNKPVDEVMSVADATEQFNLARLALNEALSALDEVVN